MKKSFMRKFLIIFFLVILSGTSFAQEKPASGNIEAGKKVYIKRCEGCHGVQGGGDGFASDRFDPKPRDFIMGLYKYRTTPNGSLPTDADLIKVVTVGLPGTGMPSWSSILSDVEIKDVVSYIKTFSNKFERQKGAIPVVEIGNEIPSSKESIEKGKALFKSLECFKCHGEEGRGNGPSALTLADDKGDPIRPRNLTLNWHFRGGGDAKDIYMRVNTGLNGTPMPSFKDSLDNEKSWHLANYIRSLSPDKRPEINSVIKSKKVLGNIPADPSDQFWQESGESGGAEYWFPMVGQVIREPRHFTPTVRDIFVKSVYSDKEVAFLVRWNDPSQSKDGEALPSAGGGGGDDLFGGEEAPVATALDDAIAIQFPGQKLEGLKKPYFVMGDAKIGVNLWTWKAGRLTESNANGIDNKTDTERAQKSESQALLGGGGYKGGQYSVVIKRSLITKDTEKDVQFEVGKFVPIAFYAWDGHNAEAKSKRALSHWYFVLLEPPTPNDVYVKPPLVALGVFGFLLLLQRKLRKDKGEKS